MAGNEVEYNDRTSAIRHPHVSSDPAILGGEPVVRGTRTPVRAVVEIWRLGVAPEDIPTHRPHLTLGQEFGALSYFADHPAEITRFIEANCGSAKLSV